MSEIEKFQKTRETALKYALDFYKITNPQNLHIDNVFETADKINEYINNGIHEKEVNTVVNRISEKVYSDVDRWLSINLTKMFDFWCGRKYDEYNDTMLDGLKQWFDDTMADTLKSWMTECLNNTDTLKGDRQTKKVTTFDEFIQYMKAFINKKLYEVDQEKISKLEANQPVMSESVDKFVEENGPITVENIRKKPMTRSEDCGTEKTEKKVRKVKDASKTAKKKVK